MSERREREEEERKTEVLEKLRGKAAELILREEMGDAEKRAAKRGAAEGKRPYVLTNATWRTAHSPF